jgi:mono/diheme cytochrome c family protein
MLALAAIGLACLAITGCPQNPPAPSVAPKPGGEVEPGPFAEGRKVYQSNNCTKCHAIGDPPPGGPKTMGRAPKLTTVGAKRSRDWIVEHIRDPKVHNESSKMPAYGADKISDADMQALADYLASLK